MSAGRATAVLLVGTALVFVAAPSAQPGPTELRLPDLVILPHGLENHYVDRQRGRLLLRFTTEIANVGQGPMEVRGSRTSRRQPMTAYQILYVRGGGRQRAPFGQFEYHEEHRHWHLLQVAVYRLRDASGQEVGISSRKVSFCLRDDRRAFPRMPGSPGSRRYGDCPDGRSVLSIRSGISIGWLDDYAATLPDQWVDVTGVPPGNYGLEVEVNPDGIMQETDRTNNITSVPVQL